MSRHERRALIFLFLTAVAGHLILGVRGEGTRPVAPVPILDAAQDGDPLAHRDSALALARPLGAAERIDAERASVAELQRLPGIGPAVAKRIVADRQNRGAFGSVAGLDRVPGIGPATLARLAPHLSFAGVAADAQEVGSGHGFDPNVAGVTEWDALPGIGPARARAIVAFRDSLGPFRQLDDLRRIPGVPFSVIERLAPVLRLP